MYNNCVIYIIVCSFREVGGVYEYLLPQFEAFSCHHLLGYFSILYSIGEGHYNKAPIMDHWNAKAHSFELTYIGTANSARRFMPPYLKKSELKLRRLMRYESVVVYILYSDYESLIAYTSKDYNHANFTPVYIISSQHMYNITFEGQKRKPVPMLMYNVNKKGVDKGNQMLAHNSVYRASRGWTDRIFCNYLDIAALNSWVIVRYNNTDLQYPVRKSGRRRMLRELALQLETACTSDHK